MFYCSPCSLNRQPSWSQFPRIKLICIHQLIVNSSFLFFRSDPLPGWEISFLIISFLYPSPVCTRYKFILNLFSFLYFIHPPFARGTSLFSFHPPFARGTNSLFFSLFYPSPVCTRYKFILFPSPICTRYKFWLHSWCCRSVNVLLPPL